MKTLELFSADLDDRVVEVRPLIPAAGVPQSQFADVSKFLIVSGKKVVIVSLED